MTAENGPSGLPSADPLKSAMAINHTIGRLMNLPAPDKTGVLYAPGRGDQIQTAALVSIALSLTDIARSLRTPCRG
ncbi:hypothetical protein ACFPC0_10730 [Streptomyces andamanensis]|uniref:Uncharacterized protein n=1 Tax=Streptomyces andamanensis TaxID=1565035 RepID=A0ABV8TCD4_9ACTN